MSGYSHTQPFTVMRWMLPLLAFVGVGVGIGTGEWSVAVSVGIFAALLAWLFHALTVEVDGKEVRLRFGGGLIHRRIPREDIVGVEIVQNKWWYGFGIRLTPHGWLWNVSGLDAVELTFKSGKRFRIGTDEPQRLAEALDP